MNERWPGTRKIWCYWHFHWSLWIFLLQSFPFTALSLQHISIFMVMVTLSMTLKTYLHINLLCHNILSFFIGSLSHLVQNPLLIAMEHLWQKALHKKLIETDLSLQSCLNVHKKRAFLMYVENLEMNNSLKWALFIKLSDQITSDTLWK